MATQQHVYVDGNILPASWLNDEWTQLYTKIADANIDTSAAIARSKLATTGADTADAFTANGLTGATAASRYAGATTGGKPSSGTFAVGDFVFDQGGTLWICTVAGTPGTWQPLVVAIGKTTAQKIQFGTVTITVASAGVPVTSTVTYATSFVGTPFLLLAGRPMANSSGYTTTDINANAATGFTGQANSAVAQSVQVDWIAIGN